MWSVPARVSTSWTSMSGLTPGVILRNTFISESSPKATEEFDCSPEKSVEWVVEVELVPAAAGGSARPLSSSVRLPPVSSAAAANARSHSAIASRSCSASYAWTQPNSGSSHQPMKAWSSRGSGSV